MLLASLLNMSQIFITSLYPVIWRQLHKSHNLNDIFIEDHIEYDVKLFEKDILTFFLNGDYVANRKRMS